MKILSIPTLFALVLSLVIPSAAHAQKIPAGSRHRISLACPADQFAVAGSGQPELLWKEVIRHPGASYVSIHFAGFRLGPSDYVRVSNGQGQAAEILRESGVAERWTRRVPGETAVLELFAAQDSRPRSLAADCYTAGYHGRPGIESVIGWNDLENAACYRGTAEYDGARPVARLLVHSSDADYWGTGFLVSAQDHFLTARHLISSSTEAASAEFEFMSEAPDCDDSNCEDCYRGTTFVGSELVKLGSNLDFTLVRLTRGNPAAQFGFLELEQRQAVLGEEIYIPQHPGGRAKEFAIRSDVAEDEGGVCRVQSYSAPSCDGVGSDVGYYADTEGGSSGAPVLARNTRRVLALHHCGGPMNRGVPSQGILEQIRCVIGVNIDTTEAEVGADGGDVQLRVEGCSWRIQNPCSDWIDLPVLSGTGPRTVAVKVSPNYSCVARTCELLVEGNVFALHQAAGQGIASMYPRSTSFGPGGGVGRIEVSGDLSCGWAPSSDSDWIVITAVVPNGDKAIISYAIAPAELSTARSGKVLVGGWQHSIVQTPPQLTPTAGAYNGLFSETGGATQMRSGLVKLKTTAKGTFSGTIQVGSRRYSATGAFDPLGTTTKVISRAKDTPLTLRLIVAGGDTLVGSVGDDSWTADLVLQRSIYDGRTAVCPESGSYTVVFEGQEGWATRPAGSGYGIARVDRSGRLKLSGSLADGTKISQAASVGPQGEWPLYVPLYSGSGFLHGPLLIKTDREVEGILSWLKPASSRAKYYPAGFEMQTSVKGCRFAGAVFGTRKVLPFTNGQLILDQGSVREDLNGYFTLGDKNKVTQTGDLAFYLNLPSSSGMMTGRMLDPFSRKWISFRGVVLQRWSQASGYFLNDGLSGRVVVHEFEGTE